jgi:hypothetical protein
MTNAQMIQKFAENLIRRIEFRMNNFGDSYEKAKSCVKIESCAGEKCWAIVDKNFANRIATTTSGRFQRQMAESQCQPGYFIFFSEGSGGPIDAPSDIPAGCCNSVQWKNGLGKNIPAITTFSRD